MAKNKIESTARVKAEELENLTATENFIDKYKKVFLIGGGALIAIVLGFIGYKKLVSEPHELESQNAYTDAFYDWQNDSLTTAVAGTSEYDGMEDVAAEYGGTSGGDIANYALGTAAMNNGDYESALGYFDECGFDDVVLGSMVIGLKGDCYVELDRYEDAADAFENAADREKNDFTTPMYLLKAGLTYEEIGNNEKALAIYQDIKDNWSKSEEAQNIEKYIARAKN